jgi:hypothetical protein
VNRTMQGAAVHRFALALIVALWAFAMFASAEDRGFSRSGELQIAQVALASAPGEPAPSLYGEPLRGPVNGLAPALLGAVLGEESPVALTRTANTVAISLAAVCLFLFAARIGGALAGLGAAVTFLAVPRIWAAAIGPGLTAAALLAITAAAMAMERGRTSPAWAVVAVLTLWVAMLTTQLALLLGLVWVYLTFFGTARGPERGTWQSGSMGWWAPLVFPVAFAALVGSLPLFVRGGEGSVDIGDYLSAFLALPRVATLYLGEVYAAERLPWHAAPALQAFTLPPTLLFLTVFGLIGASPWTRPLRRLLGRRVESSRRDGEALRLAWACLLLTLVTPLLLGTVQSHGVDLLALAVPWLAVYAGVALRELLGVVAGWLAEVFGDRAWARWATLGVLSGLGWGVFAFALEDTTESFPELESYYNWLVSGVDGAAELGLPRNPEGPIPASFLTEIAREEGPTRIALLPPEAEDRWALIDSYRALGLVPPGLERAGIETADAVLFVFDERGAGFYTHLADFLAAASSAPPERVLWRRREGLPLFGAVRFTP